QPHRSPIQETLMASDAGYMRMGSQPVAGRARAMQACASLRPVSIVADAAWLDATRVFAKPATTHGPARRLPGTT
ncbi:MAG TPA: hypothetical protein VFK43_10135, partial [Acidimicrobiales bacterium]|nr:hypothetical protein [Acidimicrobiales bacterium]